MRSILNLNTYSCTGQCYAYSLINIKKINAFELNLYFPLTLWKLLFTAPGSEDVCIIKICTLTSIIAYIFLLCHFIVSLLIEIIWLFLWYLKTFHEPCWYYIFEPIWLIGFFQWLTLQCIISNIYNHFDNAIIPTRIIRIDNNNQCWYTYLAWERKKSLL